MKKIIIILVLLSIRVASFAQESTITQQNNSYTAFVANTFQNVNMSYVPTGFLMDKAFPLTNPDYWTGTTALTDSTNMDLGRFSPLYLMLQSAKVSTPSVRSRKIRYRASIYNQMCRRHNYLTIFINFKKNF